MFLLMRNIVLIINSALIMLCFITPVNANFVDVWEFNSEENEARAIELVKQLRCPECQNQNLIESTSPIARDLRVEVYQLVDEGKSDIEIIELMVSRFGDFVLYKPKFNSQTLLLWLAPLLMLVFSVLFSWRYIKKHSHTAALSYYEQQYLQQELKLKGELDIS